MAQLEYITIRYSNTCDIGNIIFQDNFTFELNIIGVLGEPKYEHIEKVTESEAKEIHYNSRTLKKSLTLAVTGNEQLLDVLNFIKICDTKIIINKAGEVYNVNEMTVEGDLQNGINIIKIQFVLFNVTNTGCCTNNVKNDGLLNFINIVHVYTETADVYLQPSSVQLGTICILIDSDGRYILIVRSNTTGAELATGWNYYPILTSQYAYNEAFGFYGQRYLIGEAYQLITLPYLESVTNTTGTTYKVLGQSLEGYVIGFQIKDPSGSYVNANINGTSVNYTTSLNYNGSGITLNISTAGSKLRAYLATLNAPATPLCYSNEKTI